MRAFRCRHVTRQMNVRPVVILLLSCDESFLLLTRCRTLMVVTSKLFDESIYLSARSQLENEAQVAQKGPNISTYTLLMASRMFFSELFTSNRNSSLQGRCQHHTLFVCTPMVLGEINQKSQFNISVQCARVKWGKSPKTT